MGIWLVLVTVISVAMLLGIIALTNRIQSIDERLDELRHLELELTRTFKWAIANQSSELNTIKLRLDQLNAQQSDLLRQLAHRVEPPNLKDIAAINLATTEQITIPHSD